MWAGNDRIPFKLFFWFGKNQFWFGFDSSNALMKKQILSRICLMLKISVPNQFLEGFYLWDTCNVNYRKICYENSHLTICIFESNRVLIILALIRERSLLIWKRICSEISVHFPPDQRGLEFFKVLNYFKEPFIFVIQGKQ